MDTTTTAQAADMEQPDDGFICKRCGEASPLGVGYAARYPGARIASSRLTRCQCGHSQLSPRLFTQDQVGA